MATTALLVLCLVACGGLHLAGATIDYSSCVTVGSDKGRNADCPAGRIATALCTSGHYEDCNGYFTQLLCCTSTTSNPNVEKLSWSAEGSKGVLLECPTGYILNSVCSSGKHGDCGNDIWTRIVCITGSHTSSCGVFHATAGVMRHCPDQQVIRGVCSSGSNPDCNEEGVPSHTVIKCCGY